MEQPISKKPTNFYLLFAGIIVVILLVIGYFTFFAANAIPRTFFSTYHQSDTLAKNILSALKFNYIPLSQAISTQDASSAASLTKEMLIQSLKNKNDMQVLQKKTATLKILLSDISDGTIREKVIKLFALIDDRNKRMRAVIETHVNIFTVLRNNFGALSVGEKTTGVPQNVDSVIQATQTEIQSILNLQTSIDVLFDEMVKLSGSLGDIGIIQTTDSIRMSLSVTPQKPVSITDFPTPSPVPTISATATPEASNSAETATSSAR